ncbi:MFS transporter [Amycolatopsis sp. NPDC004368]
MTTTDRRAVDVSSLAGTGRRASRRAWFIAVMLVVLMLVNWADKSVLGLAAVPISKEFGLSATQYGFISSSFFFLFSLSSVVVGILALRVRARWILAAIAVLWAVCQLPIVLGLGVVGLTAGRIALGAFEGPTSSLVVHTVHDWFPPMRRGMPTALTQIGGGLGLAVAAPTLTFLIVHFGWRSAFLALAIVGVLWAIGWSLTSREGPHAAVAPKRSESASVETERVPVWRIMVKRTWWGTATLNFTAYWTLTLISAWLPAFLEKDLGYTVTAAGSLLVIPPLVGVASQLGVTMLSDRLVRRGVAPRIARGVPLAGVGVVSGVCVALFPVASTPWVTVALLTIGLGLPWAAFPLGQVAAAEISPPRQRAAVLGWAVGIATSAGLLAPTLTGVLIDSAPTRHQGFTLAWVLAGGLMIVGGLVAALTIDPRRDARAAAA